MSRADLDAQRALFDTWLAGQEGWEGDVNESDAFIIWQAALAAQAPGQQELGVSPDQVVEANVALLRSRSAVGLVKYGTTLADSKLPLRAFLVHALEELLDGANYLQVAMRAIDSASQAPVQGDSNSVEFGRIKAPVQGEPVGDEWITAQVARHLDIQFRNGVSAGWNAGVDGDGEKLAQLKSRVGTKAEYAALFPAAPVQGKSVASDAEDAARLDWLNSQAYSYGFEDMHEGNRWGIEGPFSSIRDAIDAARKAGT